MSSKLWFLGARSWLWLLVFCLLSCGNQKEQPLNVLLITMDTTRADRLGCYGYDAIQTPAIDALANKGVRYEKAYTVAPITLPSHLSMLSGTYPAYHSVRENAGYFVPKNLATLPKILKKHGFDTAAVVGAFPLDSQTGLDQGFDLYDDYYPSNGDTWTQPQMRAFYDERPASEVAHAAMKWLDDRQNKPFFLWTHFFDAHQPWTPPSPFRERYLHSPYDAEIASVDASIGRIIAKLEELNLADNTLIILTADHGEGLGDHGELTHALFLYSSTIRVPLIVKDPTNPTPGVVNTPVGTLDIFSTVLSRLGFQIPDQNQGLPLPLSDSQGDPNRQILSETMFGRLIYGWSPLKRLTAGDHVLIHGPSNRLFDRHTDPGENHDLATSQPSLLTAMRNKHRVEESKAKRNALERIAVAVSQEDMERLAALGYVGSGMAGDTELSDQIDPKRRDPLISIDIFELQNNSRAAADVGNHEHALQLLDKAYAIDPQNPMVVQGLANSHLALGNMEIGLTYLETLRQLAPQQAYTYVSLARYHHLRGQLKEAADLLHQAIDLSPSDLSPRILYAYTLEDLGKPEDSEAAYREILALDEGHILASNGLATLLYRQGRQKEALRLFESVLEKQPFYAPAHLNLAILEFDQGNLARAEMLTKRAMVLKENYTKAQEFAKRIQAKQSAIQ